jgi:hypothetical protein
MVQSNHGVLLSYTRLFGNSSIMRAILRVDLALEMMAPTRCRMLRGLATTVEGGDEWTQVKDVSH